MLCSLARQRANTLMIRLCASTRRCVLTQTRAVCIVRATGPTHAHPCCVYRQGNVLHILLCNLHWQSHRPHTHTHAVCIDRATCLTHSHAVCIGRATCLTHSHVVHSQDNRPHTHTHAMCIDRATCPTHSHSVCIGRAAGPARTPMLCALTGQRALHTLLQCALAGRHTPTHTHAVCIGRATCQHTLRLCTDQTVRPHTHTHAVCIDRATFSTHSHTALMLCALIG